MGLLKHGVDQRGLAMVDVSYDCNISNIAANSHSKPLLIIPMM
ncbi:hypothetical protein BALAC2494_01688 [Bifidobacterium animalis subsp. lactis CNCM I-2494]|uniref:Uncharacterized protein n=1 Tax=Bifidobacterium animalis subsp. lactis CNCM I-2494 TaxID=1042403 RepID=A0A806FWC5_BIFAN|nr:hypothetical protein BALAC2494_01688 [Bifidobacterium animalis subsp. lactis CNCM I-2494]